MSKKILQTTIGIIFILVFFTLFFIFEKNNFIALAPSTQTKATTTEKIVIVKPLVQKENIITIGNTKIKVEIANTPALVMRGLSGKTELKEGEGMFFIFEKSDYYPFWMKEMNFPIDIIWIDENYIIVDITHTLATSTYPNTVSPKNPARYVLEVPAGFSNKKEIREGARLDI